MEPEIQKREKKREQNRRSQKISRERQTIRIKELEERILLLEATTEEDRLLNYSKIIEENSQLRITLGAWKRTLLSIAENAESLVDRREVDVLLHLTPAAFTPDSATFPPGQVPSLHSESSTESLRQLDRRSPWTDDSSRNIGAFAESCMMRDIKPQIASIMPYDILLYSRELDARLTADRNVTTQETWMLQIEDTFRSAILNIARAPAPVGWGTQGDAQYERRIQLHLSDKLAQVWHDLRLETLYPFTDWTLFAMSLGFTDAHTTLMRFRLFPCEDNWLRMSVHQLRYVILCFKCHPSREKPAHINRPTALQLSRPIHHTYIDYVYWPELRDCLLVHPPKIGYERLVFQILALLICEVKGLQVCLSILQVVEEIRISLGIRKDAVEVSKEKMKQVGKGLAAWGLHRVENWRLHKHFFELYPEGQRLTSLQTKLPLITLSEAKSRVFG